jgi:hypothetical protein
MEIVTEAGQAKFVGGIIMEKKKVEKKELKDEKGRSLTPTLEMSLLEFESYIREHPPKRIAFATENQEWHCIGDPCEMNLTFKVIRVSLAPDMVILHNGGKDKKDNVLWLKDAKSVEVKKDKCWTEYDVVCPGLHGKGSKTYTLIAD